MNLRKLRYISLPVFLITLGLVFNADAVLKGNASYVGAPSFSTGASGSLTVQFGTTANDTVGVAATTGTLAGMNNASGIKYQLIATTTGGLRLASDSPVSWNSTATLASGALDTTLGRQAAGLLVVGAGTATPAGGVASPGLVFGSTAGFGIYIGSGLPTLSAAQGSIYLRSDGSSTSTRLYVNTNGTTGWTNVTTAT